MVLTQLLITVIVTIIVFLLSALPLYFAVKFLGGKTTLFKTALVTFISGIVVSAIKAQFKFGWLLAFFILIWIYHEIFRLKWMKAFIAWILQFIFIAVIYVIVSFILVAVVGISVLAFI